MSWLDVNFRSALKASYDCVSCTSKRSSSRCSSRARRYQFEPSADTVEEDGGSAIAGSSMAELEPPSQRTPSAEEGASDGHVSTLFAGATPRDERRGYGECRRSRASLKRNAEAEKVLAARRMLLTDEVRAVTPQEILTHMMSLEAQLLASFDERHRLEQRCEQLIEIAARLESKNESERSDRVRDSICSDNRPLESDQGENPDCTGRRASKMECSVIPLLHLSCMEASAAVGEECAPLPSQTNAANTGTCCFKLDQGDGACAAAGANFADRKARDGNELAAKTYPGQSSSSLCTYAVAPQPCATESPPPNVAEQRCNRASGSALLSGSQVRSLSALPELTLGEEVDAGDMPQATACRNLTPPIVTVTCPASPRDHENETRPRASSQIEIHSVGSRESSRSSLCSDTDGANPALEQTHCERATAKANASKLLVPPLPALTHSSLQLHSQGQLCTLSSASQLSPRVEFYSMAGQTSQRSSVCSEGGKRVIQQLHDEQANAGKLLVPPLSPCLQSYRQGDVCSLAPPNMSSPHIEFFSLAGQMSQRSSVCSVEGKRSLQQQLHEEQAICAALHRAYEELLSATRYQRPEAVEEQVNSPSALESELAEFKNSLDAERTKNAEQLERHRCEVEAGSQALQAKNQEIKDLEDALQAQRRASLSRIEEMESAQQELHVAKSELQERGVQVKCEEHADINPGQPQGEQILEEVRELGSTGAQLTLVTENLLQEKAAHRSSVEEHMHEIHKLQWQQGWRIEQLQQELSEAKARADASAEALKGLEAELADREESMSAEEAAEGGTRMRSEASEASLASDKTSELRNIHAELPDRIRKIFSPTGGQFQECVCRTPVDTDPVETDLAVCQTGSQADGRGGSPPEAATFASQAADAAANAAIV